MTNSNTRKSVSSPILNIEQGFRIKVDFRCRVISMYVRIT